MKKTIALVLSCILLISCFAACGSNKKDEDTSIPGSSVEAGLLRIADDSDIQTMDLTQTTDFYFVPMNVFDRLFEVKSSADGSTEIVGSLCEDYSLDDDAVTYSFKLREGIKFSNGADLTSDDVLFSFSRLLTAGGVNDDIALEILGAGALQAGETDTLEGFKIIDDYNFTITLAAPNAGFIAELTAPAMSVIDRDTTEAAKNYGIDVSETIGTGPYIITEWETNDHITLEINEKYWGEEPSVKKCILMVIPDSNTSNLMYQNGELDILDLDYIDSTIVSGVYETDYADKLVTRTRVALTYFALNNTNEYLQDVNVRKAIQMAINREGILTSVFNGYGEILNGIIPKGVIGFNDDLNNIEYNPEAAKALLEKSGYKEGEIKIELSSDSNASASANLALGIIQQDLKAIGIEATLKSYDESSWLDLRKSGNMDTFIATWTMDYNDPANIMYTFFGSKDKTLIRSLNYQDIETMSKVESASSIVEDDDRYAMYQALEKKIVVEDAAWVPLYATDHLFAVGDRIAEFIPHWAGYNDQFIADITLK